MSNIQADIEARLREAEPQVEVLLAEVVGGDLSASSSITRRASRSTSVSVSPSTSPRSERYALEVSSPGPSARSPSPSTSAAT